MYIPESKRINIKSSSGPLLDWFISVWLSRLVEKSASNHLFSYSATSNLLSILDTKAYTFKTCIHFRVDPSADTEATHTHANISTCTCNKNTKGNSQLLSCSLGRNLSEATAQFIWSIVPWVKGRTLTFPSDRAVGRIMTQTEDHRLPQLMVKDMKQRRSNPQSCLTLTLFFFVETSHDYRYSFWASARLFLTKSQVPGLIQR